MARLATSLQLSLLCCFGCASPSAEPVPAPAIYGALGEAVPGLSQAERASFERGRAQFARRFTPEEGLGRFLDATACVDCHDQPVAGGAGGRASRTTLVARVLPDGTFIGAGYADFGDLDFLSRANYFDVVESRAAPLTRNEFIVDRVDPPALFGFGVLAAIPEDVIWAHVDPSDEDGDGIRGRPNFDQGLTGRFGHAAQLSRVDLIVLRAFMSHLGITATRSGVRSHDRLPGLPFVRAASGTLTAEGDVGEVRAPQPAELFETTDNDGIPDPEVSSSEVYDIASYLLLLAAPEPDPPTARTDAGHRRFEAVGCADCHMTLDAPWGRVEAYTDLLVHDMGDALARQIPRGTADVRDFRTSPLWGVAATAPYLHDGRAETLDEAILAHGGEAQRARDAYADLDAEARSEVLDFLRSLGGHTRPDPTPEAGSLGGPDGSADRERFARGRERFRQPLAPSQGLGPRYDADRCVSCHGEGAVGGAGSFGDNVIRQGGESGMALAGGSRLSRHAVTGGRPAPAEGAAVFELRQPPALYGLGWIARVPDVVILAAEDPDDLDGDGISGRAHRLPSGDIGRFGWRAQAAALVDVAEAELAQQLGVTASSTDEDDVADPEMDTAALADLVYFLEHLAPPMPRSSNRPLEQEGEVLFEQVGCASCHRTLRVDEGLGPFAEQNELMLYSDLLLHSMLPDGSAGVGEGDASPDELRTAPLWGLSRSAPYMHDGRASTVEQAIAAHFGEASASADAFAALSATEREGVLAFLRSL